MEEEQIISADQIIAEENKKEEDANKGGGAGVNKALMGIVVVLLMVITGGGAYYLGTKGNEKEGEALPTQSLLQTETLGEETENVAEVTVTPTIDPLITPSVTPGVTAKPTFSINPNLKIKDEIKFLLPTVTPTPIQINKDLLIETDIHTLP